MWHVRSLIALCVLAFLPVIAQGKQERTKFEIQDSYIKIGYLDWSEKTDFGNFVMRERTVQVGVGAEGRVVTTRTKMPLSWFLEATAGLTSYEGSSLMANIPRKSLDAYAGVRGEIVSRTHWASGRMIHLDSFMSVGGTTFIKTAGPELWNELYTRTGVEVSFQQHRRKIFVNCGIVRPILVLDHGFHENIGYTDADYLPHGHVSFFAELGVVKTDGRKFSLAFDSIRLGQSAPVRSHEIGGSKTIELVQPATRAYTVSFKCSYRFGR